MLQLNKKASSIIMIIFEVIAVLIVVGVTFSIATHYATNTNTKQTYLAEEMRMMVNTLIASPGDVFVQYPKNVSLFKLTLTSDEIKVESLEEKDRIVTRSISLPKGYVAVGFVKEAEKLCLEKKNKNIIMKEC